MDCPYCAGKKVNITNCINTTHPEIAELLWNPEDRFRYTAKSSKRAHFKCKECSNKIENRIISNITSRSLSCPYCGDSLKYPEKFMLSVLKQLNLKFDIQKMFNWSDNKRYDFYIQDTSTIIETHGIQHYKNSGFYGRDLNTEKKNDEQKKVLALNNAIKNYIVVDCSSSELEFIKNNILNSKLSSLYNLNSVDWIKCHTFACSSLVKQICDMWSKENKSSKEISEETKISRTTVTKYLKQGAILNWCNYDSKIAQKTTGHLNGKGLGKPVIRLTLHNHYIDEYSSASEAARQLKIYQSPISKVCAGKMSTYKGYKWIYKKKIE